MCKTQKVSVIMPVYNVQSTVAEAIDSVLTQDFGDFELIIVDDCSTDGTIAILEAYSGMDKRIRVLHNSMHAGVARSLNRALQAADGGYIARMDGDDVSLPSRFSRQLDHLSRNPIIGVVGTGTTFIELDGQESEQPSWTKPSTHNLITWSLLYSTPICHPTVMMRASVIRQAGGYDSNYLNEDMQLWTRMVWFTRLANLDEILLKYRMPSQVHREKLAHWEPHIRRVISEFVEKVVGRKVADNLIRLLMWSGRTDKAADQNITKLDAFAVATLLEEIHSAMVTLKLLEHPHLREVERELIRLQQRLVSAAF